MPLPILGQSDIYSPGSTAPDSEHLDSIINDAARKHNIPDYILRGVGLQESGLGKNLDSNGQGDSGHGNGIWQVDDRSHPVAVTTRARKDPAYAADYAAGMLASNFQRYGTWKKALSAYNAGDPNATGTMTAWGDQKLGYYDSVMRFISTFAKSGEFKPGMDDVVERVAQNHPKKNHLQLLSERVPILGSKDVVAHPAAAQAPAATPAPAATIATPTDEASLAVNPKNILFGTAAKPTPTQVGELLQRGAMTVEAILAGHGLHGAAEAFRRGNTESMNADRAVIRGKLASLPDAYESVPLFGQFVMMAKNYSKFPHVSQGLFDAVLDTAVDPTTYLGGSGLLERAYTKASPRAASMLARMKPSELFDYMTFQGSAVRGIHSVLSPKKAVGMVARAKLEDRRLASSIVNSAQHKKFQAAIEAGQAGDRSGDAYKVLQAKREAAVQRVLHGAGLTKAERAAVLPHVSNFFQPGNELSVLGDTGKKALGFLTKKPIQLSNFTMFSVPFGHMANITSLGLVRDPVAAITTLGKTLHGVVSPTAREANKAAVIAAEKAGYAATIPEKELPPFIEGMMNLVHIPGRPDLSWKKLYDMSQKTLWPFDTLMRGDMTPRSVQKYLKEGYNKSTAAAMASEDINKSLVEYGQKSPFIKDLGYFFRFPAFRAGILGAVARAMIQHPERFAIADRLTQGQFTGGQVGAYNKQGTSSPGQFYLPPADVGRAMNLSQPAGSSHSSTGPDQFLRSSLFPGIDTILSLGNVPAPLATAEKGAGNKNIKSGSSHFFSYGRYGDSEAQPLEVLPQELLSFPGSNQVFSSLGLNYFTSQDLPRDLVQQLTRIKIGNNAAAASVVTKYEVDRTHQMIHLQNAQISGDGQAAKAVAKQIEQTNKKFVKDLHAAKVMPTLNAQDLAPTTP